jgi:hypothetical protein
MEQYTAMKRKLHAATWMNPTDVMLSKRHWAQEEYIHVTPLFAVEQVKQISGNRDPSVGSKSRQWSSLGRRNGKGRGGASGCWQWPVRIGVAFLKVDTYICVGLPLNSVAFWPSASYTECLNLTLFFSTKWGQCLWYRVEIMIVKHSIKGYYCFLAYLCQPRNMVKGIMETIKSNSRQSWIKIRYDKLIFGKVWRHTTKIYVCGIFRVMRKGEITLM